MLRLSEEGKTREAAYYLEYLVGLDGLPFPDRFAN